MEGFCSAEIEKVLQNMIRIREKTASENQRLAVWQREFAAIRQKYSGLYGEKHGEPVKRDKNRIEEQELERLMHLVRAQDAQPQKAGLFGWGGLKREEYHALAERLDMITSNLEMRAADNQRLLQDGLAEVKRILDQYEETFCSVMKTYTLVRTAEDYPCNEELESADVLLGEYLIYVSEIPELRTLLNENRYSFYDGSQLHIVLTQTISNMSHYILRYGNREQLEKLYHWIGNLFKQLLLKFPVYHFQMIYLDGINNASGLKELLSLQKLQERDVPDLQPQCIGEGRQILKVCRDSEAIRRELAELERYMGTVADLLQGEKDIFTYNLVHDRKIPFHLVVLEGMDEYAESAVIRKFLTGGLRYGICCVVLQGREAVIEASEDGIQPQIQILCSEEMTVIRQEGKAYQRVLLTAETDQRKFVENVINKLNIRETADNRFASHFSSDYCWGSFSSTTVQEKGRPEGRLTIPFAVNSRGQMVSFELGSPAYAHGLISGGTGSGKSTLLHMIINSVVINYHPDDVEIWLADYKQTEFAVYIGNRPPHIRFIGIERNEEFTRSFLDMIYGEYERRSQIFLEKGVRNIDAYKEHCGLHSMSRILVIIDEFHLMAQQVEGNDTYSRELENILSEARAAGIICLFADQAISVGLKGLSAKGKKQMRQRMAMANDLEEIRTTLDIQIAPEEAALDTGEVLRSVMTGTDKNEERELSLEKDKVIFLPDECREQIARKAIDLYGGERKAVIVDGRNPAVLNWELAEAYEQVASDGRETYFLHLGKPSNFDVTYAVSLIKDYGQNIMCLHENNTLQKRILWNAVRSFLRDPHNRIVIYADENDSLYRAICKETDIYQDKYDGLSVCTGMEEICSSILEWEGELQRRRRRPGDDALLMIWLGLDSFLREFAYYEPVPKEESIHIVPTSKTERLQTELERKFAGFFGEDAQSEMGYRHEKEQGAFYNVTEQVISLFSEGAKRGIFQMVFLSGLLPIRPFRSIRLEWFKYKMSGYMDREDAIAYYGSAKFMNGMSEKRDNPSVICYDGKKARFFIPYTE